MGSRKIKKLKYSRLEENWGEQGGNMSTARVENKIEEQMSQLKEGAADHPDLKRMRNKR